jgi:cytidylate kinase
MTAPRKLVVAIDGPAGSGKSTIAARLARKLGYINLESGAMYRALALKALQNDVALNDAAALRDLAERSSIELQPAGDGNRVLLDGMDVSRRIRDEDVTVAASQVSVHPPVRQVMVVRQRQMGAKGGVVMEGRDIGTAVFPNAEVKIFLDADPAVRAERRVLQSSLHSPDEAQRVKADIAARDQRDRTRTTSPLVRAADAVVLDTTHMNIDEVVEEVYEIASRKTENKDPEVDK